MVVLLEDIMNYLVSDFGLYIAVFVVLTMGIIYCLLNLIKKPIKALTVKIKNEKLRHLANKSIIVLSFILSTIIWVVLHYIAPKYFEFSGVLILVSGALPVVLYALTDGVISTNKASKIVEIIKDITEDKQVSKDEIKGIAKDITNDLSVESELDNLLK